MAREFSAALNPDGSRKFRQIIPFSAAGDVKAEPGTHKIYNDTGETLRILSVRASVGTAPTGSSLIVDVNLGGTTIFTTQANRPAITSGSTTSGAVTSMNVVNWAPGQVMTVDVDQVGSTTAGKSLTVQVVVG